MKSYTLQCLQTSRQKNSSSVNKKTITLLLRFFFYFGEKTPKSFAFLFLLSPHVCFVWQALIRCREVYVRLKCLWRRVDKLLDLRSREGWLLFKCSQCKPPLTVQSTGFPQRPPTVFHYSLAKISLSLICTFGSGLSDYQHANILAFALDRPRRGKRHWSVRSEKETPPFLSI